ncbi:alanine:cation symporter family protein, partial [Staphylococcus pasteuri]|uniref:alanine:cation symporter family protein n=1 Tax=Staphylococcus pasteuri TaxID=45972 RepID=UPI001C997A0E
KEKNDRRNIGFIVIRLGMIIARLYGGIKSGDVGWGLGDLGGGLMAWLKIIGIWIVDKGCIEGLKDYEVEK